MSASVSLSSQIKRRVCCISSKCMKRKSTCWAARCGWAGQRRKGSCVDDDRLHFTEGSYLGSLSCNYEFDLQVVPYCLSATKLYVFLGRRVLVVGGCTRKNSNDVSHSDCSSTHNLFIVYCQRGIWRDIDDSALGHAVAAVAMVQGMIINTIIWVFHIQMFRFKFLSYVGSPADRLYHNVSFKVLGHVFVAYWPWGFRMIFTLNL